MPSEKEMAGYHFLRRHSSLWEKGQVSPDLDVVYEENTNASHLPWETSIRAPVAVPFVAENMPLGGQSIDPSEGHAGEGEEVRAVESGWVHRGHARSDILAGKSRNVVEK